MDNCYERRNEVNEVKLYHVAHAEVLPTMLLERFADNDLLEKFADNDLLENIADNECWRRWLTIIAVNVC